LWDGRRYSNLHWAIGLHRGLNGTVFYLTPSQGFPYIPRYVYLPDSPALLTVFDDHEFMHPERALVLAGWRNPARIIAAHHRLRADAGQSTLWAIVSTMPLDAPARLGLPTGIRLLNVDPDLTKNPLYDPATATKIPELAVGRQHRLAVADPELWSLVGDVHSRWQAALELVSLADGVTRERAAFTGVVVSGATVPTNDPHAKLLADVVAQLQRRERPDDNTVRALRSAYSAATLASQTAQHTPQDLTDDTGYVDAYRRARAWEAAVILVEAVNAQGNEVLPEATLADIAYCAATAHMPFSGDVAVGDVLRACN
jgi:hypothetical protein